MLQHLKVSLLVLVILDHTSLVQQSDQSDDPDHP